MNEVEFVDSGHRKIRLSAPVGGSGSYQLYIDKFYYGNLVYKNGKWIGHLNNNDLTSDDIQILGDIIDMKK